MHEVPLLVTWVKDCKIEVSAGMIEGHQNKMHTSQYGRTVFHLSAGNTSVGS